MSLTAKQAASRLPLAPNTFRQKLREGVVEGRLEEGRWVVEEQDLLSYAQKTGTNDARIAATPDVSTAPPSGGSSTTLYLQTPEVDEHAGAWLLLAVGDDRAFGSNDGYDDEPETHYRWDDTVPNHAQIKEGDAVVLWDKKASIGASVIDSIQTVRTTKPVYSCPKCGRAHIKARKTMQPRYRCFKCSQNFDEPVTTEKQVLEYTATYAASWVSFDGLLDGSTLRSLCVSPKSQLSLRPMRWNEFRAAVSRAGGPEILTLLEASMPTIQGGHKRANVRVRVGQGAFRRNLLAATGAVCVFSGPAPAAALEAAHLYSFAKVGEHREHGGLLMRRDLHRLFDLGLIAVNPRTLTIDVAPTLAGYPMYKGLDGRSLTATLRKSQVNWLIEHWTVHRPGLQ